MEALDRWERYAPGGADTDVPSLRREGGIILYWAVSIGLGLIFARPEIFHCQVPTTLLAVWPWGLLALTLAFSQWLYGQVAIAEDRPFNWTGTPIFVIGNAVGETLAFLLVFKFGAFVAATILGALGIGGTPGGLLTFGLGFFVFLIYGGSIHGLFWMRIFPPHFKEDERSRKIRKFRLWSECLLSFSWCLTFFLFNDLWSVVFFHAIVDIVLMIRVRPRIFRLTAWFSGHARA